VTPEEKRNFLARRAQETEQRRALFNAETGRGNSKEISQNSKSIPERKPWSNLDLRPDMGSLKHAPYAYQVFITPIDFF
jgi:hypothetical protein